MTIAPVQDSRLVDITFSSADPALAAAVANGVTDAYVEGVVEQRFLVSREAADWLTRQLAEHRLLVEASEAKLQQFREVNGALAVDDGQDIVVRQLTDLNGSVTRARTVRLEREALYNQLSAMGQDELGSFPAVLSNPSVQGLRAELADLERDRGQLAETFGDRHPEMIRVEAAILGARDRLDAQVARVIESVRNEYESALANERSLTAALDAQKAEALALNRRSTEYSVLLRETESNRQVYEGLLAQAQEINISSDLRRTNVRVVDAAEVPTVPSSPRIRRDLTMAALGGLLLAVSLVLVVEYLDNRIKDPDELFASIGIPVIGMVPRVRDLNDTPLFPRPVPPNLAEAIRSVRTNVLFSSADEGTRIVLVTSPGPGEGKSLIAGSLAWSLGQAEQRVLLIDADMRRPRVHEVVGCTQEPGLSDVLVGQSKMRDVVRKTLVPGLSVIPGGHIPPNPAELLGSERFRSYVRGLGASYDWVVIDSPPVLAVTDASILTNVASGILLVTGADKTTRQAARTAVERLQSFNGRLIGAVLNGVDVAHSPYYYASYYRKDYARYYTGSAEAPERGVARSEDRAATLGLRK